MSTFLDMDDELIELVDQIRARLKLSRAEVIGIALGLLAARMHMQFVPSEDP